MHNNEPPIMITVRGWEAIEAGKRPLVRYRGDVPYRIASAEEFTAVLGQSYDRWLVSRWCMGDWACGVKLDTELEIIAAAPDAGGAE